MSSALKASQVDLSKITFSAPKTLDNGGKMLFLNYGGGINPFYITLPEVEVPFDPMYFADNDTSGKYNIKISLKDLESNNELKCLHEKLGELDTLLKEKAIENSQQWFRKAKLSSDTINELYTPLIKVATDPETGEPNGKYPPKTDISTGEPIVASSLCTASIVPACIALNNSSVGTNWSA